MQLDKKVEGKKVRALIKCYVCDTCQCIWTRTNGTYILAIGLLHHKLESAQNQFYCCAHSLSRQPPHCDISQLMQQLTRLCDQKKERKWLLNDLASSIGPKKKASGNCVSMNTATAAIPRRVKERKRGAGIPAAASSATHRRDTGRVTGGRCDCCKKHSPSTSNAWKTHPTKYCRKWNRDDTSKSFSFGNGRVNGNGNGEPHDKKCPTLPPSNIKP